MKIDKIGLGGGCHWCTEAVFQNLHGVVNVEQGWISASGAVEFSEAVLLDFNPEKIPLKVLIEAHLHTHKCTSNHSMRSKYRSAVYAFSSRQQLESEQILKLLQKQFEDKLITKVYGFEEFKMSAEQYQNYYQKNPEKPFCKTYIDPKLNLLPRRFPKHVLKPTQTSIKRREEQNTKK
ncbi:peptide-methionine (S)-S-oxide reductase [uncultured Eudoraea sp.]|uniref:peptide-methionine (S)-S-oxide reductase n=1 Tax=uncultured Eudoraea sp. TaxID=1035614 RepID=UPI00262F7FBE|nr:peptide-methionine (S)-S-oxide reductase [uncultured Eudoraea sp.]